MQAGSLLTERGAVCNPAELPELSRFMLPMFARWFAAASMDSAGLDRRRLERRNRRMAQLEAAVLRMGLVKDADRIAVSDALAGVFECFDALLMPTTAEPPGAVQPWHLRSWSANLRHALPAVGPFFMPWNMAGCPAVAVPLGSWPVGTPQAVQIVAAPGGEALLIAAAAAIERQRPWPRHAPLR